MIAQLNSSYLLHHRYGIWPRLAAYFFYEGRPATTKGRWFNPVTFRYLQRAMLTPVRAEAESPIFITGMGRSGTTILGMTLSAHREVAFLNEPKALWYAVNHADDLIGSYSTGEAKYLMDANDATAAISTGVKAIYSSLLHRTNRNRVVDKYPEMIFRFGYLNAIFNNAKFIFLHRRREETIASTAKWSEQHGNAMTGENWWGANNRKWNLLLEQVATHDESLSGMMDHLRTLTSDSEKASVEWTATMNYGMKMAALHPDKILPIRFEDFTDDTEQTLHRICEFTGLTPDPRMFRFAEKNVRR